MLRLVINLAAFLPSGFIIGRKIGRKGWFYGIVTPFFVVFVDALTVIFIIRLTMPRATYLMTEVAAPLLAGFIGGLLGQVSKRGSVS